MWWYSSATVIILQPNAWDNILFWSDGGMMDRCLDPKSNSPYPASHVKMKKLLESDDSRMRKTIGEKMLPPKKKDIQKNKKHPEKKKTHTFLKHVNQKKAHLTSPYVNHLPPNFQGEFFKNTSRPSPFEVMVDQKGKRLPARPPLFLDLSEAVGMVGWSKQRQFIGCLLTF